LTRKTRGNPGVILIKPLGGGKTVRGNAEKRGDGTRKEVKEIAKLDQERQVLNLVKEVGGGGRDQFLLGRGFGERSRSGH